jgi:dTDP-4-dehydrorhamnose reductase
MLGHRLHETLGSDLDVVSTTRRPLKSLPVDTAPFFKQGRVVENIDVSDLIQLRRFAREARPDVVINCVGVIKQREAARSAIPSIQINALFPHQLAQICAELEARLIHFSTDCVFSGAVGGYSELDVPDATDLYGRTKSLGDVVEQDVLTIRTSMIGRELDHFDSLLEWFLRQRGEVRGFTKAIFSGLTTLQLARVIKAVLLDHPGLSGVYHVASTPIDKYTLLALVSDHFGVTDDVHLIPDDSFVCDRSLRGSRFVEATAIDTPSWDEMVKELSVDAGRYGRVL